MYNTKQHYNKIISRIFEPVAIIQNNIQLIMELAKREMTDRYAGQMLGKVWSFVHPLVLIFIYIFIFVFVFKVKMGSTRDLPLDFTAYLLSGLIPWMCFQESMNKGTGAITGNANLVKQVIFPIEILPVKSAVSSIITMSIYLSIFIIYVFFSHGFLFWTYLLIPVLIFLQIITMTGINFLLSSIGAYFRDLKDLVQVFTTAGVYLIPVVYLPSSVPELFRPLLYLNIFSYYVWVYQDVLYYGRFEHWWAWIVVVCFSLLVFFLGYRVFAKLKVMFGSVI